MTIAQKHNHDFQNGDFKQYDSKGNLLYFENAKGFWCWSAYDEYGNEIIYVNSDKYFHCKEYTSTGLKTHYSIVTGKHTV